VTLRRHRLHDEFYKYFPSDTIEHTWVLNPFAHDLYNLPDELSTLAQEELLSLATNLTLAQRFKLSTPEEFWMTDGKSYERLYSEARKMFLRFPTSYLCEKGFSVMLFLKNKQRSRLDVEPDMRIKLSNTKLDWNAIVEND
jgi:zinc finger BED domain-containing protein 5/7/8/9